MPTPVPVGPAGFLRRLAALLYDTLLLFAVLMAVTVLYLLVRRLLFGDAVLAPGQVAAQGPLYQLILVVSMVGFLGYFWRRGRTLGMQAWRLRLVNLSAGPVTWKQVLIRCAGAAVGALCMGIGYLSMLWHPERRCWHDRWSHTAVVLLPKPERKRNKRSMHTPQQQDGDSST